MEKFKLILISIIVLIAMYLIVRSIIETPFEKLPRDYFTITDYRYDDPSQVGISEAYQESGIDFREIYDTENRFLLHFYDSDSWIFWTGVQDLDDGLKFLYTPHYSRLVTVDRNTKQIISNSLFLRNVTNSKIHDGYVYFVYSSWTGYKLGRYKL